MLIAIERVLKMVKYVVVVKDILNGKDYYLNPVADYPVADYLDQLTTDLSVAPKFSSEELAEEAYWISKGRIPIGCPVAIYALEGEDFKLYKTL